MLETFFCFVAVAAFFVDVFFEETLGVVAFLTVGFEIAFTLGFLDAGAFLAFSIVSLEVIFILSAPDFFTAFAEVLLGLSLAEDGFLAVVALFLAEAGFLF